MESKSYVVVTGYALGWIESLIRALREQDDAGALLAEMEQNIEYGDDDLDRLSLGRPLVMGVHYPSYRVALNELNLSPASVEDVSRTARITGVSLNSLMAFLKTFVIGVDSYWYKDRTGVIC